MTLWKIAEGGGTVAAVPGHSLISTENRKAGNFSNGLVAFN
jgi:hypothetical protein